VNQRKYDVGSAAQLLCSLIDGEIVSNLFICLFDLDIASGSTVDWAYDVLKCKHSYTIELPPSSSRSADRFYRALIQFMMHLDEAATGFVLPVSLAPSVCRETYIGMKAFLVEVKKEVAASSSG
jgi:hypothetical protein